KRIRRIEHIIPEETESASRNHVPTGSRNNIDDSATGSPQLRGIVAAIDLELLDCFLAQRRPHPTEGVIRLHAITTDAVSSSIASIEKQPAMRHLNDPEIRVVSEGIRIGNAGCEQRECEVRPPIDWEIANRPRVDSVGLLNLHVINLRRFIDDREAAANGVYL